MTEMFMSPPVQSSMPSQDELAALCFQKYGELDALDWGPRQRLRYSYFQPMDIYEAVVGKFVAPGCCWLDAGGGQSPFPENPDLVRRLAGQCSRLVAVDPSGNVQRNRFAHEREQCALETYESGSPFDLVTARMVVEHVGSPEAFVQALARLVRPGGVAIVLTVNLYSLVTLVSRSLPFSFHRHATRFLWRCDEEDVFPTVYRMNTRGALRRLFEHAGFEEREFMWLDDLCIFSNFRRMNHLELLVWSGLHRMGVRYPENRLLGIYVRN